MLARARLAWVAGMALAAAGCAAESAIDIPAGYDWLVVWFEPNEGAPSGALRRRSGPLSFSHPADGRTLVLGYRSSELSTRALDIAALDGSPVVLLAGCGPSLPAPAFAWVIGPDGPHEASPEEVPALRAEALECEAAGGVEVLSATPRGLRVVCPTVDATPVDSCTLCFQLSACGIASPSGACGGGAVPLLRHLDGRLCDEPVLDGLSCGVRPPQGGALLAFECQQSGSSLTLDVSRLDGSLGEVRRFPLAAVPPDAIRAETDHPEWLELGWLADLVVFEDRVVVLRRPTRSPSGCEPNAELVSLSLEGEISASIPAPVSCLAQIEPDPEIPRGLLAVALSTGTAPRLTAARLDSQGGLLATAARTLPLRDGNGETVRHSLKAVVVTGTRSAHRVTAFVEVSIGFETRRSWTTWALKDSGLEQTNARDDPSSHASSRWLFAAPAGAPGVDQRIVISDDDSDGLLLFEPPRGTVTATLVRDGSGFDLSQGPVVASSTAERWLVTNGGNSAGAVTIFAPGGQVRAIPYLRDNNASLTGLLEAAPDQFLVVAFRWVSGRWQSELSMLDTRQPSSGFGSRFTALTAGMAGFLSAGARCPDEARVRTAWGLSPWTAEVFRVELPCE
ncbi:MAG: hypothetical protein IT384_15850 [Deltaproteobacteria bacterium]|nr:hypothetical protein [Deltaproteobacteria bacterium]